jgi:hypothetical protein
MKQKSLRQLAKDLGVSHSYLSQVRHGKRPASEKVVSKMVSNGKQNNRQNDKIFNSFTHGGVLELADRQDLGSCAERREGSSPSFPTSN